MSNLFNDIHAFHEKYRLPPSTEPGKLSPEVLEFRIKFMQEELDEFKASAEKGDLEGQLDALVDLVYVALGTAYLSRFPFMTAWERVQQANMMKVRAERKSDSKRGSQFDVVKPEHWRAPDHEDLVENSVTQMRKFLADLDLPDDQL